MPEIITITRTEWPDLIEIGRVSKGGILRIHFNASDLTEAQKRIDNAIRAREYLIERLAAGGDTP